LAKQLKTKDLGTFKNSILKQLIMEKRLVISVYGKVQMVGFRDYVFEIATKLEIKGYVKNEKNPSLVTIVAEGEEKVLNEFVNEIKKAKKPIIIKEIKIKEGKATGEFEYFDIIRDDPTQEIVERIEMGRVVLFSMLEKHDRMLELQGKMLEKQDKMLELQEKTIEKLDRMNKKLDRIDKKLDKIDTTINTKFEELNNNINNRFDRLEGIISNRFDKLEGVINNRFDKLEDTINNRFNDLDIKYGKISQLLERISIALETLAGLREVDKKKK
jgi:acylphosphatase